MTKTTSTFAVILAALVVLASFALAVNVSADTRDSRDRGSTGRTIEPAPTPTPSPAPSPAPTPTPPPPQGGITNVTSGGVSSGGNTGGNITTGDEYVEVHEVNIGPTNPPPPPPPQDDEEEVSPPAPAPQPACETDARGRTTCPTDTSGRAR